MKKISTVIANPTRTAVQLVPAAVCTEFVDAFIHNMGDKQYAAMFGMLALVFSVAQNAYENYKGKGFLRHVPPVDAPVPADKPAAH